MKVSKSWLKDLVNLKIGYEELERLLPLRTIGTKEITDNFIELDMKGYNRADLLSMRGVALEVAAITDSSISFKEMSNSEYIWVEKNFSKIDVEVTDTDLIPVYCLAKIEGLAVDKSPEEWVKKLQDSGMRTVNNIADVTNLVMLEFGQPLHSFDATTIEQEKIIVRSAKDKEELVTLDEKKRQLNANDIVIADSQKAVGLAGVMGGKNSEVTDSTQTILLEAAIFDPISIRKTASRLNLNSEASKRFQHGLTKKRLLEALNAAIMLYQQLGGTLTAITLVGDLEDQKTIIPLSLKKINELIGVKISAQFVEDALTKLQFNLADKVETPEDTTWVVSPPFYRLDISIPEDVIEEVARLYGYEKIQAIPLTDNSTEKIDQRLFSRINSLRDALVAHGLTEVQTYSFYSQDVINNVSITKDLLLKLTNPMSSETEYLRDSLWPNLVEVTAKNLKYGEDVAVFEIGKVYNLQSSGEIKESYHLAIALSDKSDNPLAECYQILKESLKAVNQEITFDKQAEGQTDITSFHPNRLVSVKENLTNLGIMAEIHKRITDKFGIKQRLAIAEIEIK